MENLPFDRFVAKACLYESVVDYAKDTILGGGKVSKVQRIWLKKITSQNLDKPVGRDKTVLGPEKGRFRCKGTHYLSQCPDRAKKCSKCGNKGHSEKFCNKNKKGRVKRVQQGKDDPDVDVSQLQGEGGGHTVQG
jgi:hypothetical protein